MLPHKTLRLFFYPALFLSAIIFFCGACRKESSEIQALGKLPDFTTKVTSSVSGFVTDENEAAVNGASVVLGDKNATTDKYGYFEIKNAQVVAEAAVVTVNQPGYFKGIKTYIAAEGKSAFFRIKLLPKTIAGNIDAGAGGTVTLSNNLSIVLPANAVVNAATNAAYSGAVSVSAKWIDPTANELNRLMPGDLRGLDDKGFLKSLTSYGMAAVELRGASGELLQVAAGKKAILTFPIPAAVLSAAPSTIPLWYFDEEKGLWKQEGSATKSGNNYTGEVSHFSFWNCDVSSSYVQFNCTIRDANSNPIANTLVKISVSGTGNAGYGYTDSSGFVSGAVPDNAQLLLEVLVNENCNTPVFTHNFNTTNTAASLGVLVTPAGNASTAHFTGTVVNCTNAPVNNGHVFISTNSQYSRYPVTNGAFDFNYIFCNGSAAASIIAEDYISGEQSTTLNYTLHTGNNAVGSMVACGVLPEEYVYSYQDTFSHIATSPSISYEYLFWSRRTPPVITITFIFMNGLQLFDLRFTESGIAAGSTQQLLTVGTAQLSSPLDLHITEYGAIGEFIAGNYTGRSSAGENLSGRFRVRRRE